MGGRAGAGAGRRLGRPRAVHADADQGRRQRRRPARTAAATCTSASASTAWARSSTASCCSGFRAFGAGFFIFSDYMKASLRLAAIMRIPTTFVFTHDSIGVGEDGPTHQPIEQLAALRATPNINVVRPAGFNETALAWRFALQATETPTALALSRQGVPVWDPDGVPRDAIERGAYVLRDSDGEPDLILMALGHRGPRRPRRAQAPRGRGRQGAAREHAVPGPLRGPGPGLPRQRPAAVDQGPRGRRGRRRRWAGTAGSATPATSSRWRASAPPPPPARSTSTLASRGRRSPKRARAVLR